MAMSIWHRVDLYYNLPSYAAAADAHRLYVLETLMHARLSNFFDRDYELANPDVGVKGVVVVLLSPEQKQDYARPRLQLYAWVESKKPPRLTKADLAKLAKTESFTGSEIVATLITAMGNMRKAYSQLKLQVCTIAPHPPQPVGVPSTPPPPPQAQEEEQQQQQPAKTASTPAADIWSLD